MNEFIYIPDTNLFYNLAESIILKKEEYSKWHVTALKFWRKFGKKTKIPSIVLAEFCGLWFHKNVDLKNYDFWFRNRLTVFNQMYFKLKRAGVEMCDESIISLNKVLQSAVDLTRYKMSAALIDEISNRLIEVIESVKNRLKYDKNNYKLNKTYKRFKKNLNKGKLLDGLDSIIVSFAYELGKYHDKDSIIIVSCDKFMVQIVNYYFKYMKNYKHYKVPENVSAYLPQTLTR